MRCPASSALVLAGAVACPMILGVRLQAIQTDPGTLETLKYRTGWVYLGGLTRDRKSWAVGADATVDYLTGGFEIVGGNVDRRKPILPKGGERIRLKGRTQVLILDYLTLGEQRRLDAPSIVARSKGPNDATGISLASGSVVEVREVAVSRAYGEIRIVWARVTPVSK
jgi:hypothetical protein